MDPTQKQNLNTMLARARDVMQQGAVGDHARALILGFNIMQAAVWEGMDKAEMNHFATAVLDYADWLKQNFPDRAEHMQLANYMVKVMAVRCYRSSSTRSD